MFYKNIPSTNTNNNLLSVNALFCLVLLKASYLLFIYTKINTKVRPSTIHRGVYVLQTKDINIIFPLRFILSKTEKWQRKAQAASVLGVYKRIRKGFSREMLFVCTFGLLEIIKKCEEKRNKREKIGEIYCSLAGFLLNS